MNLPKEIKNVKCYLRIDIHFTVAPIGICTIEILMQNQILLLNYNQQGKRGHNCDLLKMINGFYWGFSSGHFTTKWFQDVQ